MNGNRGRCHGSAVRVRQSVWKTPSRRPAHVGATRASERTTSLRRRAEAGGDRGRAVTRVCGKAPLVRRVGRVAGVHVRRARSASGRDDLMCERRRYQKQRPENGENCDKAENPSLHSLTSSDKATVATNLRLPALGLNHLFRRGSRCNACRPPITFPRETGLRGNSSRARR